jgi:diadenosine tetraphosphate (Ap4A) HIT family hydrolase
MSGHNDIVGGYKLIYETHSFNIVTLTNPHISRSDGGHIIIMPKKGGYKSRTEMPVKMAVEMLALTMIVGEAMSAVLAKNGIDIGCINYQENGNWAYLRGINPRMHVHIYGRAKFSKSQKFGQALFFPDPGSDFYDNFEPLNEKDIKEIRAEILIIAQRERYKDYSCLILEDNTGNIK